MSTWQVQRVMPGWDCTELPAVMLENEVGSTTHLQRFGVKAESFLYAPVVREGDFYQTERGDRIRIEQKVIHEDGSLDIIIREAVDTGRPVPQFVQAIDTPATITDEERAAGDAQREQWNQYVLQQNLLNNYSAPYTAPSEAAPPTSYSGGQGGFVESEPIAVPAGTLTTTYYTPDTTTVQQPTWDQIAAGVGSISNTAQQAADAAGVIPFFVQLGNIISDWFFGGGGPID